MLDTESMPGESKVIEAIFDHRWAILPSALEGMIAIANRQGSIEAALAGKAAHAANLPSGGLPYAIQAGAVDKEIAIINVMGPIFPRANLMTQVSGATSISKMQAQFRAAMEDPNVGGIILNVDSPGGEVTGVSEFAQMMFEARGKKPITAYVPGMAASAAYWLASAADEIVAADTAEAGSIGVVAAYSDDKEAQKKRGITTHEIVSSQSPNKRPDVSTPQGRKQIQAVVDDLASIFVSTVARNRGVTEDHVLEKFGQGGMYVAGRAVDRGMVDKVGTFESVVQSFEAKMQAKEKQNYNGGYSMNTKDRKIKAHEDQAPDPTPAEPVPVPEPDPVPAEPDPTPAPAEPSPGADPIASAINAERARIQGIESLKAPGYEAFIQARKWEAGMSKEKLSALIMDDMEAKRVARGEAVRNDALDLAAHSARIGNTADLPVASTEDALVASMVAGANGRRR